MTYKEYLREHESERPLICVEEEGEDLPEWVERWQTELNQYGNYFEEVRTARDKISQFDGENTLENIPNFGIFLASGSLGYWVKVKVDTDGMVWCVPYGNDSDDDWKNYTREELTETYGADFDPTEVVLETQFLY